MAKKKKKSKNKSLENILKNELMMLEPIQSQNPETGAGIESGKTYLSKYRNRVFGSPFQLIDSVDRRFPEVNSYVGNEYMRNFMLNSPILHIKPGLPKYTGGYTGKQLTEAIRDAYVGRNTGGLSVVESLLLSASKGTIFGSGSKLQRRMFGFREHYNSYMSYVNYMCRSVATFLSLTTSTKFPNGTFSNGHEYPNAYEKFEKMRWENYRYLSSKKSTPNALHQLNKIGSATLLGAMAGAAGDMVEAVFGSAGHLAKGAAGFVEGVAKTMFSEDDVTLSSILDSLGNPVQDALSSVGDEFSSAFDRAKDKMNTAADETIIEVIEDKVCSVAFMVEPTSFEENLTNETSQSLIAQGIDNIRQTVGSEIAFVTQSNIDFGHLENLSEFLGNTVQSASSFLQGLVNKLSGGGFLSNLFSGGIASIKGQKMIYPDIYTGSESSMTYSFTVNLTTPYGDVYNYYMNILVPLLHLIALTAPRMITANSVASPFLVQAYIPGMCTCELGIISNMTIQKNPNQNHVSVQGFPLDVKVEFQIKELYNALSISPANDPASFLFNECLSSYMANMAGLIPSVNTYNNQRIAAFKGVERYFGRPGKEYKEAFKNTKGGLLKKARAGTKAATEAVTDSEWMNDLAEDLVEKIEDKTNPAMAGV